MRWRQEMKNRMKDAKCIRSPKRDAAAHSLALRFTQDQDGRDAMDSLLRELVRVNGATKVLETVHDAIADVAVERGETPDPNETFDVKLRAKITRISGPGRRLNVGHGDERYER